jgi:acetyl coenzyme A synthetase (ADP forming)-like protein
LLEHLSHIARAGGITEFEADVLGDNTRMLEVFARSGFHIRRAATSGVVHLAFSTEETHEFAQASQARERTAASQSVAWILRPRSVAVIGASRDSGKIGGAVTTNLKGGSFNGPIYPVNPTAIEIQGIRCYPSVSEIGEPVDLAVITVPADAVEQRLAECASIGVHAVVVITSGFGEVGSAGRAAERRLVELVRRSGMRMVGPNCMGVLNTDPAIRLNATFAPVEPPVGNIGMFSQSGALGIAILDHLRTRGLGLSSFVSAGNRADISNNDLLAYWAEDINSSVIVLYLESVGNPRKFAQLAREAGYHKPIIAVKSGRSVAGKRAATSHSASLASLDVAVDALFEQAGVVRTETLEELFDVTALFSTQPIPAGPRVGVVTNAGGPAILLADACEARGLTLPPLDKKTLAELRSFLPQQAGYANPIDMTATASGADFERTFAAVGNDPNVDSVVAVYIPPMVTQPAEAAAGIVRGAAAVPAEKPLLSIFLSSQKSPTELSAGPRGTIPAYEFPESAAIALAAAYRYGCWRSRPRGNVHTLSRSERDAIRVVVEHALDTAGDACWLSQDELTTVLRTVGIDVAPAEQTTVEQAREVADRIGYPLVAKAVATGVLHKSDVGGVIMGLNSPTAVADAAAMLRERMAAIGASLEGVLLQRQIDGGIETLIGVTTDPTFGPLLVCGFGGTMVELLRDVAFRLHPVTDVDAAEMIAALRSSRLLDGYRGAPLGDRDALISLIMRVSALVEAVPELSELDLNPVKVLTRGNGGVVVDGRLRLKPRRAIEIPT